jgi:di/tricarboxylate transporter
VFFMTPEIVFMLVLMGLALVAFVREIFPIEVTALGIVAVLLVTGIIGIDTAIAGLSSRAVVTIGSLFVLSRALIKTGLLETVADTISRRARHRPGLMTVVLLVAVAVGSGVLNNTAVVAVSIPLVMKLCRRVDLSPSKALMPISYASIFGGTLTLIGTSTNLLVSEVVVESGRPALGVFAFTPMGSVLLVVGLAYVVLAARPLLPRRAATGALTEKYRVADYLTEVILEEESRLIGTTLTNAHINERYGVTVLEVIRGSAETHVGDVDAMSLRSGDRLIVQGSLEDILRLRREQNLALLPDVKLDDDELAAGGQALVEAWVRPGSSMIGRTLKQLDFHYHLGGFVLAVSRVGETLRTRVSDVVLRFADALLVLVPRDRISDLEETGDLVVLSEHDVHLRRAPYWWLVLLLLPLSVALAAFGVMDIAAATLISSVVLLLFGVLTPVEAYRSVDWSVVFLIAAFVPLGHAVTSTGTAGFLAHNLLAASSWAPSDLAPYVVLSLIYLTTAVLTQLVSNSAAVIIATPIALSLASELGVDWQPLVFAVAFAGSAAFMTPMGYQTNLMVYAAGEYRFLDYVRFGAPLNLLFWLLSTFLIPVFWPF